MTKMEGRLLILDTVDSNGMKFAKNCKITMPNKVPVVLDYNIQNPKFVVGDAELTLDSDGISCSVNLTEELNKVEYYVGGFYDHVESHKVDDVQVIDSCRLNCISITKAPADKNLKIVKV